MSVCISQHGEYGSHTLDAEYTCTRCGVLDEDALTEELRRLRQELDEARAERERLEADNDDLQTRLNILADAVHEATTQRLDVVAERDQALALLGDAYDANGKHQAERDRMRPVIEAAEALYEHQRPDRHPGGSWWAQLYELRTSLHAAVVAYRASTSGQPADDRPPESYCHCCGGPNISWSAPSPLWNAVMRGGSINGPTEFDEIICPLCFAALAIERGVAGAHWRFFANDVQAELELVTPTGRVWSSTTWLWETPGEVRRGGPIDVLGHAPVRLHPESVEKEVSNVDVP